MAFPTIPTTAAGDLLSATTSTTSTTHTFPNLSSLDGGGGPNAGDLLLAVCVQYEGDTSPQFSSWGASFSEILDDSVTGTGNIAIGVAYKIATGSESGTFTVTSANSFRSVNFLMRIPAGTWHGTTIPEVLAVARQAGASADPGSFNPTNWDAEDTLWISVNGHSETSTTGSPPILTASPTNYSGDLIVARAGDAVGHITAGVGFRQLNASSEDVGVWTGSNLNRGNGGATVIAVRPAAIQDIAPGLIDQTAVAHAPTVTSVATYTPALLDQTAVAFAPIVATGYAAVVLVDEPTSYWRLGEPSGVTAVDFMGAHDGTYVNTPTLGATGLIDDDPDTAVTFAAASSEHITVGDFPEYELTTTGQLSVEAWFVPATEQLRQSVISKLRTTAQEWTIEVQNNERIFVAIYDGASSVIAGGFVGPTVSYGTRYHVVFTADDATDTLLVYVDGVLALTDTTWTAAPAGSASNVAIGARNTSGTSYSGFFDGTIDEVAIYDHVLDGSRVLAHYVAGAGAVTQDVSFGLIDQTAVAHSPTVTQTQVALLVVADKTSLTSDDTAVRGRLLALGYSVDTLSDEDDAPSSGYLLAVIAESVVAVTLDTKYRNVSYPVIVLDNTPAVNMDLMTGGPNVADQTQVDVTDASHPAAGGQSGTVTVFSSSVALRYAETSGLGAGASVYLTQAGDATHAVGFTYDSGSALLNSHTAEAKRAVLHLFHAAYGGVYNSNALQFLDDLINWTSAAGQSVTVGLINQAAVAHQPTITSVRNLTLGLIDRTAVAHAPTVTSLATVSPGLINQAASTFSPTITTGAVSVSVGLITQAATTFAPTITTGAVSISLGLINDTATASAPTVTTATTASVGIITQSATTFAPVISVGAVNVSLGLINQTATCSSPTITTGNVNVAPNFLSQTAATFAPTVSHILYVGLIDRTAATFAPTVSTTATISLALKDQTATPFAPTISVGAAPVTLGLISQAAATFTPTITTANSISLGLISQAAACFSPTLVNVVTVARIDQTATTATPTISAQAAITPALLDQTATTSAPTVTTTASVLLALIDQTATCFAPTVINATQVSVALIDQTAAAFDPTITAGGSIVEVDRIDHTASAFAPTITTGAVNVDPALIDQSAASFAPTITTSNSIVLGLITQAATTFTPTITTANAIVLGLIANGASAHQPSVSSVIDVAFGRIDQPAATFAPTITTGAASIVLPRIDNAAQIFAATVELAGALLLDLIDQTAQPFEPTVSLVSAPTPPGGGGGGFRGYVLVPPPSRAEDQELELTVIAVNAKAFAPSVERHDDEALLGLDDESLLVLV